MCEWSVPFLTDLEIYRREGERESAPDVDVEAKLLALLARSDGQYDRQRREMLHAELAVVAEFDSDLAARVEQRIADPL